MDRYLKLPERLATIVEFIDKETLVADIGTDHGYIPVYLALNGLARRIIASDVSSGSLAAARRSAEKYCVSDKIGFIVAPGLTGLSETDVDTIVIAGVGGETIAGILEESPWAKNGKRLILQPQTKIETLKLFLQENSYSIRETEQTQDRGRTYSVLLIY